MKSWLKLLFLVFLIGLLIWTVSYFDVREVIPEQEEKETLGAGVIHNDQQDIPSRSFSGSIDDIIFLVNQARSDQGLSTLEKNEELVSSAGLKAQDMKEKEYFEHVSPEGLEPWFFVEQTGYRYKAVGENLAEGFFSARSVHDAWMNSEGHRENVLSDKFEEIGVAVVQIEKNGRESFIIVQHFGSQLRLQDLEPVTVCEKEVKKDCKDAEEKEEDIDETIKEQKKIIKKAKKDGASKNDLKEVEENLEKLEEIDDEIEEYIDKCEEYIKNCDKWI